MSRYEVALAPAAIRTILNLRDPEKLGYALATELADGPNADKVVRYDADAVVCAEFIGSGARIYTATPLSYDGYTALHRPLMTPELRRLELEQGRQLARLGFYVLDILPAESAFIRRPRWRQL